MRATSEVSIIRAVESAPSIDHWTLPPGPAVGRDKDGRERVCVKTRGDEEKEADE